MSDNGRLTKYISERDQKDIGWNEIVSETCGKANESLFGRFLNKSNFKGD
jgi:hypothetical protein